LVLSLLILNDLNNLQWGVTYVSFEPGEKALERLGRKRFCEKRFLDKKLVSNWDRKKYRTEDDLTGELKEIYERYKKEGCLSSEKFLGIEI